MPNFGRKSLRDLLFTVERFLNECIRIGSREPQNTGEVSERTPDEPDALDTARTSVQTRRMPWESAGQLLNPGLATAAELYGVKTLADVLSPQFMELANRMGIASAIGATRIDQVAGGTPGLVSVTLSRVALTIDAASETERTIIEHRLLSTPAPTLEEVGKQVGVTRERIRQVQARIERKVQAALGRDMRIVASVLKERLGHVAKESAVERQIQKLLPANQELATRLFRRGLLDEMGFTQDSGVFLDKRATKELRGIRARTRKLADDVGLVDEQELIESLPSEEWRRFWPWVRERCELVDLFGSLGIRDSGKARAKAALISIGCPATPEEGRENVWVQCEQDEVTPVGHPERGEGGQRPLGTQGVGRRRVRWNYRGNHPTDRRRRGSHDDREAAYGATQQVRRESDERAGLHADGKVHDSRRVDQPGEQVIDPGNYSPMLSTARPARAI